VVDVLDLAEGGRQAVGVAEVALKQLDRSAAGAEGVQVANVARPPAEAGDEVAAGSKCLDEVAADEAGRAGDEAAGGSRVGQFCSPPSIGARLRGRSV
jgi:hypothetical protein